MFNIAVTVFRELLEIILFIGLLIGGTRNIIDSRKYICLGVIIGIIGSIIMSLLLNQILKSFSGLGDEYMQILASIFTVLFIYWTIVVISQYNHGLSSKVKSISKKVEVGETGKISLTLTIALIIFREGAEIIIFLYSVIQAQLIPIHSYISGITLGFTAALLLGFIFYRGLVKISLKYVFKITAILLAFMAASLASRAAGIATSVGMIEFLNENLWDSSWLLSNDSVIGKLAYGIFGYIDNPNGLQMICYFAVLSVILFSSFKTERKKN